MLVGSQASMYPYSTAPVAHLSMLPCSTVVESETTQGTKAVLWGLSRAQVSRLSVFLAALPCLGPLLAQSCGL